MICFRPLFSGPILVSILLVFGLSLPLISQVIHFKNFSSKDGLPSSEVYDVYQDVNGLMWFATDRGISNFDGSTFHNFDLLDGITCSTVFRFIPQENGQIWCTTYNGTLFYFHPDDYVFHPYKNNFKLKKIPSVLQNSVYLDREGCVQIGFTDLKGLVIIDNAGVFRSRATFFSPPDIPRDIYFNLKRFQNNHHVSFLSEKSPNEVPANSLKSIKVNRKNAYFKSYITENMELLIDGNSLHIFTDKEYPLIINSTLKILSTGQFDKTHFWVGFANGGVSIYDMQGQITDHFLNDESVTGLEIDHDQGLWVSTFSSGVYYGLRNSFKHIDLEQNSGVSDLLFDNGDLLIGTSRGSLLSYSSNELSTILSAPSTLLMVTKVQDYRPLSTTLAIHGKYLIDLKTGQNVITGLQWSGLSQNSEKSPIVFTKKMLCTQNLKGKWVQYLLKDKNIQCAEFGFGGIYYGTDKGLFFLDTAARVSSQLYSKSINCRVSQINFLPNGSMIIGTLGEGLYLINKKRITCVSTEDGLTSNFVTKILVQSSNTLWVGTNQGLNKVMISKNSFLVEQILQGHGLINDDISDIVISNNIVYVGTRTGLCLFGVEFFKERNRSKDHFLTLTNILVNGTPRKTLDNLTYLENNIQLDYRAVSFRSGSKLSFRYKLVGYNKGWNYTNDRSILFQTLPHGKYTLILQAGVNGQWSKEILTIPFVISPAFYKTTWFLLSIIALFISVTYLFFKYRVLSYNRDIIRELLRQLLKRIKPKTGHFIAREKGEEIKILSTEILYVKSADNYIEIHTLQGKVVVREKISAFLKLVPDPLEYIRVHRSFIVRIDKVEKKSKNSIYINGIEVRVGVTYLDSLSHIHL